MIQSVNRAFSVLFAIASAEESLSTARLARDIGLPRTTVIRLLNTMQEIGVIAKNGKSDHYELGDKMLALLNDAAGEEQLEVMVQKGMQELSAETGETIYYCIPSGDEVLYVSQINARHAIQMEDWIGRTVPLYGTAVGKLQLAYYPTTQQDAYLSQPLSRFTADTEIDSDKIKEEMKQIYQDKIAWNRCEFEESVFAVAAPIFDKTGQLIGMLAVGGPEFRIKGKEAGYAELLQTVTERITSRLT